MQYFTDDRARPEIKITALEKAWKASASQKNFAISFF